jgi:hypothetical protein
MLILFAIWIFSAAFMLYLVYRAPLLADDGVHYIPRRRAPPHRIGRY